MAVVDLLAVGLCRTRARTRYHQHLHSNRYAECEPYARQFVLPAALTSHCGLLRQTTDRGGYLERTRVMPRNHN